jgi:hypothetical protein
MKDPIYFIYVNNYTRALTVQNFLFFASPLLVPPFETWGSGGGPTPILEVSNPEIGFRPLSSYKSETNFRNQFFSNNLVWNW